MKFCKDCRHINYVPNPSSPWCAHPNAPMDPVTGERNETCALLRSHNCLIAQKCAPDGAWFEEALQESRDPEGKNIPEPMSQPIDHCESRTGFWQTVIGNLFG